MEDSDFTARPVEDAGNAPVAPGVSVRDFSRFAGATGIPTKCPCCGQEKPGWNVYTTQHGNLIAPMGEHGSVFLTGPAGVNFVGTSCQNCGFFRTFDLRVIRGWMKENPDDQA